MEDQNPIATISLNPNESMSSSTDSLGKKIKRFFHSTTHPSRQSRVNNEKNSTSGFATRNSKFNKKNTLKVVVPVIVFLAVGSIIFTVFNNSKTSTTPTVLSAQDVNDVKTVEINKTFKFPLKDNAGKVSGTFSYVVKNAELRHQIVVKGANATSVKGRVFLIVNLKILNTLSQGLSINSRDYMRISVNGNNEWFAPDIHNDPVEAQAISTTNTRVAIAINDADENIRLQIGEIGGKKEIVPVDFK